MNDLTKMTFGLEQTFTIPEWWSEPGFTHISDTPLKREKMLALAKALSGLTQGSFKESVDIYKHLQYETFLINGEESFVITMDPGSIEVKTPPFKANQIEEMLETLFEAAEIAKLVPYRNFWYGIKGGTEGGCHINIGALKKEDNIFIQNPYLLLKYFSILHNHPCLHYPFMGIDVGPGGNAQRMDEKDDFKKIKETFESASLLEQKKKLTYATLLELFKETSLIQEKSSAPSLAKLTEPNFVIEDRAQESLRSAHEVKLIIDLKLAILKNAITQTDEIILKDFANLHQKALTSFDLWENFQYLANDLSINPVFYQVFFDRQFPLLLQGQNPPKHFKLKEGRRPRKILSEEKRNGIVVSKKIDTSYKRFEIYYILEKNKENTLRFQISASGIENEFELFEHKGYLNFGEVGTAFYGYIDIKIDQDLPKLNMTLIDDSNERVIESATFHLNNMQWL